MDKSDEINWKYVYRDDTDKLNCISIERRMRQHLRKLKLEEVGLPQVLVPLLQDPVEM